MSTDATAAATLALLDLALGPAPTLHEQLSALVREREQLLEDIDAGNVARVHVDHLTFRTRLDELQKVRREEVERIDRTLALYPEWPS